MKNRDLITNNMANTADLLLHPNLVPGYELQQLIGTGAESTVYLATDERLKRNVAIKVVELADTQARNRALNEARLLGRINHPNVVKLYDVVEEPEHLILIMEYLQGMTLAKLQCQQSMAIDQKLSILQQVSNGVQAIHNAGIVHADLTAANIWVTAQGTVKMLDLGISQSIAKANTSGNQHSLHASPQAKPVVHPKARQQALSPEQVLGLPLDIKSDVFTFGLLAYQVLSGSLPYPNGDKSKLANFIVSLDARDATHIMPSLPTPMVSLVNACLQKEKHLRPINFSAITALLQQIEQDIMHGDNMPDVAAFLDEVPMMKLVRPSEPAQESKAPTHDSSAHPTTKSTANKTKATKAKKAQPLTPVPTQQTKPLFSTKLLSWLIPIMLVLLAATYVLLANRIQEPTSNVQKPSLPSVWLSSAGTLATASAAKSVIVLPPQITASTRTSSVQLQQLQASIEDGTRRQFDSDQRFSLLPRNAIMSAPTLTTSALYTTATLDNAKAIAPDTIVQSYVNCTQLRCTVSAEALAAPHWRVVAQHQWFTQTGSNLASYNAAQYETASLTSALLVDDIAGEIVSDIGSDLDSDNTPVNTDSDINVIVSEESYQTYIATAASMMFGNNLHQQLSSNIAQLSNFILQDTALIQAHQLYRELTLMLFAADHNQDHLEQFANLLDQTTPEYKNSVHFLIDQFYLSLARKDLNKAEQHLQAITQNPNGDNYLPQLAIALKIALPNAANV